MLPQHSATHIFEYSMSTDPVSNSPVKPDDDNDLLDEPTPVRLCELGNPDEGCTVCE